MQTLRVGSSGPDVITWQKIIGVTADGAFGPQTEAATKAWQSSHGLTPDGSEHGGEYSIQRDPGGHMMETGSDAEVGCSDFRKQGYGLKH